MSVKCLWLNTIVKKENYKEADKILNEILGITSCKIQSHKTAEDGVAVIYFNIEDDTEIPTAAINRLKTNSIKWEMDFPEYSQG